MEIKCSNIFSKHSFVKAFADSRIWTADLAALFTSLVNLKWHLDVLDDNLGEKPDILIPDSAAEMRLGELVSHLGNHKLKWAES